MVEPQSLTEILQDPDPISMELCIVLELLIAAVAAGIMLLAPLCMAIVMAPVPLGAVFDIVSMALSCRSDQCQSKPSVGSNNVLPKGFLEMFRFLWIGTNRLAGMFSFMTGSSRR